MSELIFLTGTSHPELAKEITRRIYGHEHISSVVGRFADGEVKALINENVRGRDVAIVHSTNPPGDHMVEALILCDTAKRHGAEYVHYIAPYFGYGRQDRTGLERAPISASLFARLLIEAGADQLITIELHASQTQGSIKQPFINLRFQPFLLKELRIRDWSKVVFISPDSGGVGRVRAIASKLGCPVGFIDKRRPEPNKSEVMNVVGNVKGFSCILLDDMIDTGGTLSSGASALMNEGAIEVIACCTHGLFSEQACERIRDSPIKQMIVSDTIKLPDVKRDVLGSKLTVVSTAPMLAEAARRVCSGDSLTVLFDNAIHELVTSSKF